MDRWNLWNGPRCKLGCMAGMPDAAARFWHICAPRSLHRCSKIRKLSVAFSLLGYLHDSQKPKVCKLMALIQVPRLFLKLILFVAYEEPFSAYLSHPTLLTWRDKHALRKLDTIVSFSLFLYVSMHSICLLFFRL